MYGSFRLAHVIWWQHDCQTDLAEWNLGVRTVWLDDRDVSGLAFRVLPLRYSGRGLVTSAPGAQNAGRPEEPVQGETLARNPVSCAQLHSAQVDFLTTSQRGGQGKVSTQPLVLQHFLAVVCGCSCSSSWTEISCSLIFVHRFAFNL